MNREFLEQNGIDVAHGLELLGDMDMYNETLSDFLEEQKTRIPALKEYKEKGDLENYAILAHAMKSDSKYLGFTKLIELAYAHELKGKEKDMDYINENFDAFMEEANRIGTILEKYNNG
jgi:HPt (histidine-containing phosphotransfer) domain-containing protein